MVGGVSNLSVPTLSYMAEHNGRMSLPVNASSLIYSQLKHVSGVLAPEGTQGITIDKLHILDYLIGQLNRIKPDSVPPSPAGGTDARQLDALIESYRAKIVQAKAASEAMPYISAPGAGGVSLFSLKT